MFIPYSVVNPLTTIRVARRLPCFGEVQLRKGDAVEPMHIVAKAEAPADFRIVDVARELDVPIKKVQPYLKVVRGDSIAEGDLLASRGLFGGRVCRSPISGTIIGSGRGRLLIEADAEPIVVTALVPGIVVESWPAEGVVIETVGAMVQAIWGNGKEAYGRLRVVVRSPNVPLQARHIDASAQDSILVGGSTVDEKTLELAADMRVRGLIVGSLKTHLIPVVHNLNLAVLVTEGMGDIPMCNAIYALLRSLDGRDTAISGVMKQQWRRERPYIVIPMPTQAGPAFDAEAPLTVGGRVRVLRGQYAGMSGTIADLSNNILQLETGARLRGVAVDLGGQDPVLVPYVNLERLL